MGKRGSLGTSLIELLTTLTIVAILSAIAMLSLTWVIPWVKEKLGPALNYWK